MKFPIFQKWLAALTDHIAFNSHYMNQGRIVDDSDDEDDIKPLGSMVVSF